MSTTLLGNIAYVNVAFNWETAVDSEGTINSCGKSYLELPWMQWLLMGMSLAYRVVTRDSLVGHEVSKPGWFLYLFCVDIISLHLGYNLGAGGAERGEGRKAKKPFSGHLCKLLCGPLYGLLLKSACSHCANRYVPPVYPLGRQGGAPRCLMSLNVSWCLRRYFVGLAPSVSD